MKKKSENLTFQQFFSLTLAALNLITHGTQEKK